jgi:hypothetical protein
VSYAIIIAIVAIGWLLLGGANLMEAETKGTGTGGGSPLSPFADAIAHAEGFYVTGSRSQRNNNPGDMILAPPANKYTAKSDGTYAIFDTAQDGWQALEDQLDFIRRGVSAHYTKTMTFFQMAETYSPGDGSTEWATNVASFVGANPNETIESYI